MSFSIGLVGLPNTGKSTIFNALSKGNAQTANYPFTTINPNVSIVEIPDDRLEKIASVIKPPKITYSTIECTDIAGLVEGASRGEGLGNKFLEHIRGVDAVVHIIRCFKNEKVPHEGGDIDPERDLGLVETELILADLEVVAKRADKVKKMLKTGSKSLENEHSLLLNLVGVLEKGSPARALKINDEQREILKALNLLTVKPSLYMANVSESKETGLLDKATKAASVRNSKLIIIDGLLEAELSDSDHKEKKELLKEYGYDDTALERLLLSAYKLLNLITFYTIKGDETKAWLLSNGEAIIVAAQKIHSDIAKGFIKAEVVHYRDFIKCGSYDGAKKAGLLEIVGKEYLVQDGDIILFRFKV